MPSSRSNYSASVWPPTSFRETLSRTAVSGYNLACHRPGMNHRGVGEARDRHGGLPSRGRAERTGHTGAVRPAPGPRPVANPADAMVPPRRGRLPDSHVRAVLPDRDPQPRAHHDDRGPRRDRDDQGGRLARRSSDRGGPRPGLAGTDVLARPGDRGLRDPDPRDASADLNTLAAPCSRSPVPGSRPGDGRHRSIPGLARPRDLAGQPLQVSGDLPARQRLQPPPGCRVRGGRLPRHRWVSLPDPGPLRPRLLESIQCVDTSMAKEAHLRADRPKRTTTGGRDSRGLRNQWAAARLPDGAGRARPARLAVCVLQPPWGGGDRRDLVGPEVSGNPRLQVATLIGGGGHARLRARDGSDLHPLH